MIKITIIYNNIPYDEQLEMDWGFACIIEGLGKTILFDTGGKGNVLLENMKKLHFNPQRIDMIFISHEHKDHYGGLSNILGEIKNPDVYLGNSFPVEIKKSIIRAGATVFSITKEQEIFPGLHTTGEMQGLINEQSIFFETDKGIIILTGCAHSGIVKIVQRAKYLTGQNIFLVLGGFHLFRESNEKILRTMNQLKNMGVRYIAPSHCSGEKAKAVFKKVFEHQYIDSGVGKIIQLDMLK